jgi:hypothetical protein
MNETVRTVNGNSHDDGEGEVIPFVPGSSESRRGTFLEPGGRPSCRVPTDDRRKRPQRLGQPDRPEGLRRSQAAELRRVGAVPLSARR